MRKMLAPIVAIVLAAVILLGLYNGLAGERQVYEMHDLQEKMEAMLPGSKYFEPEAYTGEDANIHRVWKGETGYIVETVTYGYAGNITMLIGVCNEGNVTGLQVRDMEETYGLGANALTDHKFLSQMLNTSGEAEVGTNVDAISGATLTIMIDTLMAVAGAVILYIQNGKMFGITLIMVALYAVIVAAFHKWYEKLNREQMEDNAQLTSYLVESLNGIQTVKAYNAERKANRETEKKFIKLLFSTKPQ